MEVQAMRKKKLKKITSPEEGFALILVLWIFVIISTLGATLFTIVSSNIKYASYIKDSLTNTAYVNNAQETILEFLTPPDDILKEESVSDQSSSKQTEKKGILNYKKEDDPNVNEKLVQWYAKKIGTWYIDLEDWSIKETVNVDFPADKYIICEISSEDAKFPIAKLQYVEFLENVPIDVQIEIINNNKANKISCLESLLLIKDITPEIFDGYEKYIGLKKILTLYSSGKIYINKTSKNVIDLIPELDPGSRQEILSKIDKDDFYVEFKDIPKMDNELKSIIDEEDKNNEDNIKKKTSVDKKANKGDNNIKEKKIIKANEVFCLIPEYIKIKTFTKINEIYTKAEAIYKIDKRAFTTQAHYDAVCTLDE
jgi:hypothetical protein